MKTQFPGPDNRRAFIRVDFEKGAKVGISFSTPGNASPTTVAYDALDLSVYGIAFLAPPGDVERFTVGMRLAPIAFVIEGHQVTASGRVVSVRTGLAGGLAKIAVELTSVATDDVWTLSRFVALRAGLRPRRKNKAKAQAKAGAKLRAKHLPKARSKAKTRPKPKKKTVAKRKSARK